MGGKQTVPCSMYAEKITHMFMKSEDSSCGASSGFCFLAEYGVVRFIRYRNTPVKPRDGNRLPVPPGEFVTVLCDTGGIHIVLLLKVSA